METKKKTGQQGEKMALRLMQSKGFSLLHRNYRYGRCEIDLIVKKDDLVVFVEVKTRSYTAFGQPEDGLHPAQVERIHHAAVHYMQYLSVRTKVRFDIVAVLKQGNSLIATHFEDAF